MFYYYQKRRFLMIFYKKIFILLFLLILINFFITNSVFADEPMIYSPSAILMDYHTGDILYEKNANTLMYPASTTKILTAILAIEHCDLSEKITASESAITCIKSGYTNAKIQVGEQLSMEDLLYALLLKSANEAANVIAERVRRFYRKFCQHDERKSNRAWLYWHTLRQCQRNP